MMSKKKFLVKFRAYKYAIMNFVNLIAVRVIP